jgi:hypothetical protein
MNVFWDIFVKGTNGAMLLMCVSNGHEFYYDLVEETTTNRGAKPVTRMRLKLSLSSPWSDPTF